MQLPPGIEFRQVYYVRGATPKHWFRRWDWSDPPTCGGSHAFAIHADNSVTLLCPFSLRSQRVSKRAGEMMTTQRNPPPNVKTGVEVLLRTWDKAQRLGMPDADFGTATFLLKALGVPVPTSGSVVEGAIVNSRFSESGGKAPAPVFEGVIKPGTQRDKIFTFFKEWRLVSEAMAQFNLTRSAVLSHLHTIWKTHGAGYQLRDGAAKIVMPGS